MDGTKIKAKPVGNPKDCSALALGWHDSGPGPADLFAHGQPRPQPGVRRHTRTQPPLTTFPASDILGAQVRVKRSTAERPLA